VNAAKPARRPLPEHLPRETGKYRPKQIACPDRGGEWKHLGEDVSEILEFVPARFKLIRQLRPKLACACCERIVQAEAPSRPIERGVAADCLYLWRRRDLFKEQARNHSICAADLTGHKDLYMT
jgi:transposase